MFDNPDNIDMTALYLERYLNFGLSLEELRSGKPIIGIAQTGSDLSPCNRHHLVLAERIREGIREAGGIVLEFPVHPIQETGKRPTAGLDRNLAYLGLVELLYGYPLDGVVLTTGCDKTTPACLMAAATVNIPAIALSVGPMLNGWFKGQRTGSGTIVWKAREMLAAGEIDHDGFIKLVTSSAPSTGFCNTMGTATTMNTLAEALGMMLPGSAAIPAPYRDRQEAAYLTGKRVVAMVAEDLKPSDILTRDAFLNAIAVNSAIGGSTNAPIHLAAIARHMGVALDIADWQTHGLDVPLLVNLQPAGAYLGEDYYRAGSLPAVVAQLMRRGLIREGALTVNGRTLGDNCRGAAIEDEDVIRADRPAAQGGGGLPRAARQPVRRRGDEDQRHRRGVPQPLPVEPGGSGRLRGPRRGVRRAGGLPRPDRRPEPRHHRGDPAGHARGRARGLPGGGRGGEHAPARAADPGRRARAALPRRRAPVRHLRLAVDPQRLARGGGRRRPRPPAHRRPGADRPAPRHRRHAGRRRRDRAAARGPGGGGRLRLSASQTPWQAMQRAAVGQMHTGAILEGAEAFQRIAQTRGVPRDNH